MTPKEQRGSIGTAPHIPELGTKGVLVVNSTPVSLYPQERAVVQDGSRKTSPPSRRTTWA